MTERPSVEEQAPLSTDQAKRVAAFVVKELRDMLSCVPCNGLGFGYLDACSVCKGRGHIHEPVKRLIAANLTLKSELERRRLAIERRDARIAELEEKETCYRAAIDTIGPIENERDAALARVGELNAEWLAAMLRCPCERVATRFSASGAECLRCDDPDCDPGYAHADGTPVTDWLDLSYAALVRAGTGETTP